MAAKPLTERSRRLGYIVAASLPALASGAMSSLEETLGPQRLSSSVICLAALILLLSPAQRSETLELDGPWFRTSAEPFELYSNAPLDQTERFATRLLQLHQVLAHLNPGQKIGASLPTRVFLLRDKTSLVDLGLSSPADGVAGYFFSTHYGQFLVINADPRGLPLRTLYHEYLHHFVRAHLRFVPLWFNEGLAEYYSTFEVRDGVALVGIERRNHLRTLNLERLLSIETLHETDHRSSLYNEKNRRSIFYAQSWALVHLLLSDDYIEQTQEFLGQLSRGEPAQEALGSALAMSDLAIEIALERYLDAGQFRPFAFELHETSAPIADTHAIAPEVAAAELGRLYLELQRPQRARAAFDTALKIDPESSLALVGRGRLAAAGGDDGSAIAWFEQAINAGTSSAEPHFFLGELLLERVREQLRNADGVSHPGEESLVEVSRARQHFRSSLSQDSDQPLARWRLGQAWLFAKPEEAGVGEGLEALGLAVVQLPWRNEVALDWVQLLARQRRFVQAQAALDRLLPEPIGADEHTAGTRVIALEKLNYGAWLVNNQEHERGALIVREVVDTAHQPGLRHEIQPIADEILAIATHNRLVERYNEAVESLRRGRTGQARDLLRSVASQAEDRRLRRLARELLGQI